MRLLLILVVAAAASASDVETQHGFDGSIPLRPNIDLLLHGRLRTRPAELGLYQFRGGPILSYHVSPRTSLLGGYYYAEQQQRADDAFIAGHRIFGGVETDLRSVRRYEIDGRVVYERFLPDQVPDFNRYRARLRVSAKGPIAPYASQEHLFDNGGWRSARLAAGVRFRVAPWVQLDLGYFFEERAARIGVDRHMWLTSIHFQRKPRRGDPDL